MLKIPYFHTLMTRKYARHQSNAASVHRHYELGRPAVAFCVINDAGDKWRKHFCVGIRVKLSN